MKATLGILAFVAVTLSAQAEWLVVQSNYQDPGSGMFLQGEVVFATGKTDSAWAIKAGGQDGKLPLSLGKPVSAEEAATILLSEKYAIMQKLCDALDERDAALQPAKTSSERYYERKTARDAKARADAQAAAQNQQAQEAARTRLELQRMNQNLRILGGR